MIRLAFMCVVLCASVAAGIAAAAPFEDDLDLDTLEAAAGGDGSFGFKLDGCIAISFVNGVGDINGDGLGDIAAHCQSVTTTVVIYGRQSVFPADLDWLNLSPGEGFTIPSLSIGAGPRVPAATGIGDINADGMNDMAIPDPLRQRVYVLYGSASGYPDVLDISDGLAAPLGFTITQAAGEFGLVSSLGNAGDVNGDGIDDLVIGNAVADVEVPGVGIFNEAGKTYVILGSDTGFADTISVGDLDGSNGFTVSGRTSFDESGYAVDGIGDFDDDGFDDIAVAAPYDVGFQSDASVLDEAGVVNIVFGRAGGFPPIIALGDVNRPPRDEFVFEGEAEYGHAGKATAGIGDFNGDGIGDFVIGSTRVLSVEGFPSNATFHGLAYVLYGSADFMDPGMASRFLSAVGPSRGVRVEGTGNDRFLGSAVGGGGDINDDGYDDVMVAESRPSSEGLGDNSIYVLYGRQGIVPVANTADITGDVGFRMFSRGFSPNRFARVDIVPDMNGDGIDDMTVGLSSRAYVLFGRTETPGVTPIEDQAIDANTTLGPLPIRLAGFSGGDAPIDVTVTSSNPGLLPPAGITVNGTGIYRDITLTPTPDTYGVAVVIITALSGLSGTTAETSFELEVRIIDTDGDGIADWNDDDDDGDGVPDALDDYPLGRFDDARPGNWAFPFIEALARAGITAGCGNNNYCPDVEVTRAQMAVFLERGMNGSGYSPPAATGTVFSDVGATDFAASFIEQLAADGITAGCGNNNYCPDAEVTRDQMAVFLLRAKYGSSYSPPAPSGVFADVPADNWAAAWIEQLAAEGITAGCGNGNYCPGAAVTRDQMAVFLVRTFEL